MNDLSGQAKQFLLRRGPRVSVVLPLRNAAQHVDAFIENILAIADHERLDLGEVIAVDDGSSDLTWAALEAMAWREPRLKPLRLRRAFGWDAALRAGTEQASGEVIVTLDCKVSMALEQDLPQLVAMIEADFDVVSGWRSPPKARGVGSFVTSRINGMTAAATGVGLHDLQSPVLAFRRDILGNLPAAIGALSSLPVMAHTLGYRVTETPVSGAAPEGRGREAPGVLTLLLLGRFASCPGQFFGAIGAALLAIGTAALVWAALSGGSTGVLLVIASVSLAAGIQSILLGLVAELAVRLGAMRLKPEAFVMSRKLRRGTPD